MSIDQLMDAIGELDDGYIEEFAEIKPPRRIWRYLSAAACIALLFTLALIWARGGHTGTIEPSVPYEKVIWAVQGGSVSADCSEQAKAGEIVITAQLGYALSKSENPDDVFAVFVGETTGAAPEQIYEEFIKPLGIYEEYLDRRVIFATQEQVNGIASSKKFGIVLDLAIDTNAPVSSEPSTEGTKPASEDEHATTGPVKGETGVRVNTAIGIVDMTEQKGIGTLQALELFYEDGKFEYYFPSVRSSFVYVQYADGTQKPIKEALAAGDVTIADLDRYGIKYYKESPVKEPPVTQPSVKQPEITVPTQPKEEPTKPAPSTGNSPVSVVNIVDRVEREGLMTAQALELFYKDREYEYYFPSIRSGLVYAEYSDGTQKPIKEALAAGDVTIADLDRFGIKYYKESLTKDSPVTEPPAKQPEVTVPTQPKEEPTKPAPSTGSSSASVINIVDRVEQEGLITAEALELFYEDGEYEYYFPSIRSSLVYVEYADGTQKPIKEALAAGDVSIADLDWFGIRYYAERVVN